MTPEVPEAAAPGRSRSASRRRSGRPWVLLGTAAAVAFLGWLVLHAGYYLAPVEQQALHDDHPALRSSGTFGLWFGVAGTACILVNLTYLVRRRILSARWVGSLPFWMNLHVCSGLTAGALIFLHSALTLRSVAGVIAGGTLLVVLGTGIVGRYLHALVPRTLEGREKMFEQVQLEFEDLLATLRLHELPIAIQSPAPAAQGSPLWRIFWNACFQAFRDRREQRVLLRSLERVYPSAAERREVRGLLRRMFRVRRAVVQYHDLRRLTASWRFLHRWLALVMVGAAVFHILLALCYAENLRRILP